MKRGKRRGEARPAFVESERAPERRRFRDRRRARAGLGGQEAPKGEAVGRQAGQGQRRDHRARARHGDDVDAGRAGVADELVAGIGDERRAGVGDERDRLARIRSIRPGRTRSALWS